jgi:hypothetical protein
LNSPPDCMMREFRRESASVAFHSLTPFLRVIPPLIDPGQGNRLCYANWSISFTQVTNRISPGGKRSE